MKITHAEKIALINCFSLMTLQAIANATDKKQILKSPKLASDILDYCDDIMNGTPELCEKHAKKKSLSKAKKTKKKSIKKY